MMLKHADDKMAETADRYNELSTRKKRIEEELKKLGSALREGMAERNISRGWFGDFELSLVDVAPSRIADVDKMKEDGVFAKYSKVKNGYTTLSVKFSKAPKDGLPF